MRLTAYCALVLIPIQFGVFCVDYFGDYRVRSAGMYGGNLRGAIEKAIAEDSRAQAPAIYMSTAIPYVEPYWTFYATKMRRQDLLKRTQYFDPAQRLYFSHQCVISPAGHDAAVTSHTT